MRDRNSDCWEAKIFGDHSFVGLVPCNERRDISCQVLTKEEKIKNKEDVDSFFGVERLIQLSAKSLKASTVCIYMCGRE